MTNLNTTVHNIMNASEGQADRKRKVSESSTSCSSLDSDSNESSRESSDVRKVARLATHSIRYSDVSNNNCSENRASSSSKDESDSDSEESEKCPICLKAFKYQTLSITDTCSHHTFCLTCLEEWSKTKRTCPVDRTEFKSILVLDSDGNVSRQLPIKALALDSFGTWPPPYEPTCCEECGLFTNGEAMLICDGCGMGYHLHCLIPPMESPPTGIWLCNDCWYYYNY